jgi:hypothetical protein
MILFLRNKNNRTILDLDCYVKTEYNGEPTPMKFVEVSVSVAIDTYSHFLLDNLQRKDEIIEDFDNISELRGWLWERYFMGGDNDPEKYDDVIKELRTMIKGYAEKYNLHYVED